MDVQKEINNKLDAMAKSGALTTVIEPYFSALDQKITTTDSRISNIVANASGTGDNAELIDIRTGFDSTVYTSAGDAVRTQIREIYGQRTQTTVFDGNVVTETKADGSKVITTFSTGAIVEKWYNKSGTLIATETVTYTRHTVTEKLN
jgi:ribosomal protein L19